MKKFMFLAMAAAGMLCACSSSDDVVADGGDVNVPVDGNSKEAIVIGMGANAQVSVRGTGSVGATHTTIGNKWAGQYVNIYMFDRSKYDFTLAKDEATQQPIYNDAYFLTPTDENSGEARHMDHGLPTGADTDYNYASEGYKRSYYPMTGIFDFWGYRVDDATGVDVNRTEGKAATENAEAVEGKVDVKFTIDGTQDIMAATAMVSAADATKLMDLDSDASNYSNSVYSAKTARQSVQPDMTFNHMLTRFTFEAASMTESGAEKLDDGTVNPEAIRIKAINVYSKATGHLVAKYGDYTTPTTEGYIPNAVDEFYTGKKVIKTTLETQEGDNTVSETNSATKAGLTKFTLMKRPDNDKENEKLVSLTDDTEGANSYPAYGDESENPTKIAESGITIPKYVKDDDNCWKQLGEAIMVMPGEEFYVMEVELEQTVYGREDVDGNGIEETQVIKTAVIGKVDPNELKNSVLRIAKADDSAFEAGKSYNVRVQVYGLEQIKIKVTLAEWETGEEIEINPDNQI